jgi:hypothetical protein
VNTLDTVLLYAACAAAIAVAIYAERAHRRVRAERDRARTELNNSQTRCDAHRNAYEEQYAEVQRLKGQLAGHEYASTRIVTGNASDPWRARANEAADQLLAMRSIVSWRDRWLQVAAVELGTTYADVDARFRAGDRQVMRMRWRLREMNFGAHGGMSPHVFAKTDAWHSTTKITLTREQADKLTRDFDAFHGRDGFPLQVDGTFIEIDYQRFLLDTYPLIGKASAMAEAEKAEREAKERLDRAEAEHCSNVKRGAGEVCAIRDTYAKLAVAATKAREEYEAEMRAQTVTVTF